MIKKDDELKRGNVSSFKKFSEMSNTKVNDDKSDNSESEDCLYAKIDRLSKPVPNVPKNSTKVEKPMPLNKSNKSDKEDVSESIKEDDIKLIGKIAKFPKKTKASKAYNFLENVKISKNSIWYIMVEKDNELQMLKYNYKQGVDLNKFVGDLKSYYTNRFKNNKSICESISKITVDGNNNYSMIRNIPLVDIDSKKLITIITEDLIKLLSK